MNTRFGGSLMTAPVPWSLAWSDNGELAPQDRFDLLQSLVVSETEATQSALVAAVEQLSVAELSVLATRGVTGLCA
ncbi:MAG: hypothetical protein ACO28M_04090 [Vulcanococcus sp.]|jgi:hypothetical protein